MKQKSPPPRKPGGGLEVLLEATGYLEDELDSDAN